MKDRIANEIVPGIVFLLVGILLWAVTPGQVPTTEESVFTARTFPYIVLAVIMLCSIVLIGNGLLHVLKEKKENAEAEGQEQSTVQGNNGMLAAVTVLILVGTVVGNLVNLLFGGLILTNGFLALYRDKKKLHYGIVSAIVVAAYFMFKNLFGLNLP